MSDSTTGNVSPQGIEGALRILGPLVGPPLTVLDAGARWGVMPSWTPLGANVTVVGFEPEPQEAQQLLTRYAGDSSVKIVSKALGSASGFINLRVTSDASGSSFYQPNIGDRFSPDSNADIVSTVRVEVVSLDEWLEESSFDQIDAMKLDVQGAEYDIFLGATSALSRTRILLAEVHMNSHYEGAKLFSDNDALLRKHGFELWMFPTLAHYRPSRVRPPAVDRVDVHWMNNVPVPVPTEGSQLLWADAIYIKSDFAKLTLESTFTSLVRDAVLALGMDQSSLAVDALVAAQTIANSQESTAIDTALEALRFQTPLLSFTHSRLADLNERSQVLSEVHSIDLRAPIEGWGWHEPLPGPDGEWMRWTGPQREAAIHLPFILGLGATVELKISGAVSPDLIESIVLEVNGIALATTLTPSIEAEVAYFILQGCVIDSWRHSYSRVVIRTCRTTSWESIHPHSNDPTEFGVAVSALRLRPALGPTTIS